MTTPDVQPTDLGPIFLNIDHCPRLPPIGTWSK